MFVVNLIFLKIFIAIILQGYNDTQTQDGRLFNHDMNDKFRDVWTEFDPDVSVFVTDYVPLGYDIHKTKRSERVSLCLGSATRI
jgi:hypothetical protein